MAHTIINAEYQHFLDDLKQRVHASRYKAALSVNRELLLLYHHIGKQILESQANQGWGAKIIDQLSKDLKSEFPEMKGFSIRNLKYMRRFAEEYPDSNFVQQVVAQLPWGHNVLLMNRISDTQIRMFYIRKAIEYGWSRNIMDMQIETALHKRQGNAVTNFKDTLSSPQSDLAHTTLKDPYIFDFLSIGAAAQEREVEKALAGHMEKFILELGAGFAFVGRQYPLEVGGQDFYIDLLFYHLKLRCFVVIELKDKDFKPEYAGKMNFYLSAVDDLVKHEMDQPSIGLILCKNKNNVLAKYTLRDMTKPIGLAEYRLTESLPQELKTALPTIESLEIELSKDFDNFDTGIAAQPSRVTHFVRQATASDIPAMVALSYQKRRDYEKAQPQFWKYAGPEAEKSQAEWFQSLLKREEYILLIAEANEKTNGSITGFVIGKLMDAPAVYNPGGSTLMIDDFCVEHDTDWHQSGRVLIDAIKTLAQSRQSVQILVVCGAHDTSKHVFLKSMGLSIVSEWFVGEIS